MGLELHTQVCRKRRLDGGFTAYINGTVLCRNGTHKFVQLYLLIYGQTIIFRII